MSNLSSYNWTNVDGTVFVFEASTKNQVGVIDLDSGNILTVRKGGIAILRAIQSAIAEAEVCVL